MSTTDTGERTPVGRRKQTEVRAPEGVFPGGQGVKILKLPSPLEAEGEEKVAQRGEHSWGLVDYSCTLKLNNNLSNICEYNISCSKSYIDSAWLKIGYIILFQRYQLHLLN